MMRIISQSNCVIADNIGNGNSQVYIDLPSRNKKIKYVANICMAVSSKNELRELFRRILMAIDIEEDISEVAV